jgi:GNAT superfamily N-acetyltransferase
MYFGCHINHESIDKFHGTMLANPELHDIVFAEDEHLNLVGTLHIAQVNEVEVEFGLMVDEGHRGQKISSRMMEVALLWARNRGFRNIYLHCLARNGAILHLVHKYGLEVSREFDEADARVCLPSATPLTMMLEYCGSVTEYVKRSHNYNWTLMSHLLGTA